MALQQQFVEKETYMEDDYFAFEQTAFGRWEFANGEIRAMSGAKRGKSKPIHNKNHRDYQRQPAPLRSKF